ncbi:histidinol-phosphate transaminase [Candidatus Ishikawella capsulata]|uniref:Histidinol-phosphate aminotransferase n=1 Tax=Candidatus Ishikawaella capsulata Mpkobe TaxID=476281 RepID=C5WDA9_9ENTR|nr:histidinol-phosphate transaminase [Candidatus Ishikawaella capsulata]BAH83315.1 histidinol-phosphate aminotransferase [Candidatus Ishikawaella capsulata Mpkobe]
MNFNIKALARKNIQTLIPYQSARRIGGVGDIWLNANEYPLPISYSLSAPLLNRYPECQPNKVITRYANYANLSPDQILVSRGADEAIELLIRTFCEPNQDAILICPPTYGMYKFSAMTLGVKCKAINTVFNWQLNLSAISDQLDDIKIIFLCNPNNPTGNILNPRDLKSLLKIIDSQIILVIDEAYVEFCPEATIVEWIKDHPNLVVLRTLSKAFALAGLRCGFTLANPLVINLLLKVIAPYPLSTLVADIASQVLNTKGIEMMRQRVNEITNNRSWLYKKLTECPYVEKIFPSEANYILVCFYNYHEVFKYLWNKGIILRDQNNNYGLKGCARISIGTIDECKKLIDALHILPMG